MKTQGQQLKITRLPIISVLLVVLGLMTRILISCPPLISLALGTAALIIIKRDSDRMLNGRWLAVSGITISVAIIYILNGLHVYTLNQPASGSNLCEAAAMKPEEEVALLIANGADVNARNKSGNIALHTAAQNGRKDVVTLLIANGSEINAKNKYGETPLHKAASVSSKNVAELLIANGAEVNSKENIYGCTPLHFAVIRARKDVAGFLLTNEAHINAKDKNSKTPLHYAAFTGCKEMVELLIAQRADINAKDISGHTPLRIVTELIHGDEANIKGERVPTSRSLPLYSPDSSGYKDVAELLHKHGGVE